MECPYCKQEMKRGYLKGDGRRIVRWHEEGKNQALADKIFGVGLLDAVEHSWGIFKLAGEYCEDCKKLIIDTGITE